MELSKIKLSKPYDRYTVSFRKAIESETGWTIDEILAKFQAEKYSYTEVAEHLGCTVDVIYSQCRRSKIKLATKRHLAKTAVVEDTKPSVDYLYKKWSSGTW